MIKNNTFTEIKLSLGIYKHYKGQHYKVTGLAHHSETKSPMVLYQALYPINELEKQYGNPVTFARPYELFTDNVTIDNKTIPRFKFIKEN